MPLINSALKDPGNILPWGTEPDTKMHWFGLTDGDYWLSVADKTLFEYTNEIIQQWGTNHSHYTDYNIVRILEDFSSLFTAIAETIPEELYRIAKSYVSLYDFYGNASIWMEQLEGSGKVDDDLYFDRYDKIIEWIYKRTMSSVHLRHGPHISFFRCRDELSIVWRSELRDVNGIQVWTAGNGEVDMPYEQFVEEVRDWGERFFASMETQIDKAFRKNWGTTKLDPDRITEEQKERKKVFIYNTNLLMSKSQKTTDWSLVMTLIQEMAGSNTF